MNPMFSLSKNDLKDFVGKNVPFAREISMHHWADRLAREEGRGRGKNTHACRLCGAGVQHAKQC